MTPSQQPTLAAIISKISSAQNSHFKVVAGPFKGRSHTVYEIQSEGGGRWCLRIPVDAGAASFAAQGTTLLKHLKERRPALPVPAVIYESDQYTVMEYFEGEMLKFWNTQSLTQERRRVLLDGLAAFLFSLWTFEAQVPQDIGKLLQGSIPRWR
jgi:hypothetical protein